MLLGNKYICSSLIIFNNLFYLRDQWIKELMGGCLKYVQKQKQQAKLKRRETTPITTPFQFVLLSDDSRRMTLQESARGKLLVTVIEAADLIASSDGKSDPFCVVKIGENQESATPTIQDNLNPQWNYAVGTQYRIYLSINSLCIYFNLFINIIH